MRSATVRTQQPLRWIAVLPRSLFGALLASFPIHWSVMLIDYFGTEIDKDGTINYTGFLAALPAEVLELFMLAFTAPLIVLTVGAYIAPKYKFIAGICLAILYAISWGVISTFIANDISGGLYTAGRWLRLAVTVFLQIGGVAGGLFVAHRLEVASRKPSET